MKKTKRTFNLLKINIIVTVLIILSEIVLFTVVKPGNNYFNFYNVYLSGFLFFIYLFLLKTKTDKDLLTIKQEIFYLNYNFLILIFGVLLLIIFAASGIYLVTINNEAAHITFMFTLFMSIITMLAPAIFLIILIYFIIPVFIIPSMSFHKNKEKSSNVFLLILFILYLIFCIYKISERLIIINNIEEQDKIKSSKITIRYSTDFLKLDNSISSYGIKLMSKENVKIPFFYTSDSFPAVDLESAENFCKSLDARIPNYLEIYHIVFNKFDTFGEQYYWTRNKDGDNNLVLHFKNMSYEIIKKPKNIKPLVYCTADANDNLGIEKKAYFYRKVNNEQKNKIKFSNKTDSRFNNLNKLKINKNQEKKLNNQENETLINTDTKHVSFSVKEVNMNIFQKLIDEGYSYNPNMTVNQEYETNEIVLNSKIRKNTDKIRLCYYPFTDYGNLTKIQEKEIWQQSFCSPAFDLVNMIPVIKTKYDKDSYCYAYGGRLPNIPELNGILKTLGKDEIEKKYWINAKISDLTSNDSLSVLVYYKDLRFMKVKALQQDENEQAYAYCIKNPEIPSKVIANYKSRFAGTDGSYYAKQKCPECYYYEIPDTVLKN